MAVIDLIRHGETDAAGRLLGRRSDPALSAAGWRQLERQTAGRSFGRIISSPLQRARAPAERLAQERALHLAIDPDWAELDFGTWDGRPLAELQSDQAIGPGLAAIYRSADAPAPPEGESWQALRLRTERALRVLADAAEAAPTLIVTHAGPMRAALSLACDIPFDRLWLFKIDYATRITLRLGSDDEGRLWGEIVEIVQSGP